MGSKAYSIVLKGRGDIRILEGIAELPHTELPGYGICGFIRMTEDLTCPRKKAQDLKSGDLLVNVAIRSRDPWKELPFLVSENGEMANIWRLEWFPKYKEDGGYVIKGAEYLKAEYTDNLEELDGVSRAWIEKLLASGAPG